MNRYELDYRGSCFWKNVDMKMVNPFVNVELVEVNCDESKHQLVIKLIILSDTRGDAESVGKECIHEILDRFTFVCEEKFSDPELQISTDDDGNRLTVSSTDLCGSVIIISTMTEQQKQDIENLILNSRSIYYSLFRAALKQDDIVAKYMFLYSIILKIFNDSQVEVDKFIFNNEYDGNESVPRRNKKLVNETIFTVIRNDVGHVGRTNNVDSIRLKMNEQLHDLTKYVRSAIIYKLQQP